jgi:hypothetical protein
MDFTALFQFVERFGPEVSGRNLPQPVGEHAEDFERFIRGEATTEERQKLCELLRDNPHWLRWLASRIKEEREQESNSAS